MPAFREVISLSGLLTIRLQIVAGTPGEAGRPGAAWVTQITEAKGRPA